MLRLRKTVVFISVFIVSIMFSCTGTEVQYSGGDSDTTEQYEIDNISEKDATETDADYPDNDSVDDGDYEPDSETSDNNEKDILDSETEAADVSENTETDGECVCNEVNSCCDGCNAINENQDCDSGDVCAETSECNQGVCEIVDKVPNDCGDFQCGKSSDECFTCGECSGSQMCYVCDSDENDCFSGEDTKICAPSTGGGCGDMSGLDKQSPWSMAGGCPSFQGRNSNNSPDSPSMKWAIEANGKIFGSPVVSSESVVYFGTISNKFYAVNQDGTIKWTYDVSNPILSTPAIGSDGTIYFTATDIGLVALNKNGAKKWIFYADGLFDTPVSIGHDGTIYFGAGTGYSYMYAVNPDGTLKWAQKLGSDFKHTVTIGRDKATLYAGADSGELKAMDLDGREIWRYTTSSEIQQPSIGADDTIYFTTKEEKLYAIDAEGRKIWNVKLPGTPQDQLAIGKDGTIYLSVFGTKRYLLAYRPDGMIKWRFSLNKSISSAPVVLANNTVAAGCSDGRVYVVNTDGTLKWSFYSGNPIRTAPVVDNSGVMYFGSDDNYFYALGLCNEGKDQCVNNAGNIVGLQEDAIWPMRDGNPTHQGRSTLAGPDSPTLKWVLDTESVVPGSFAVDKDGNLYFVDSGSKLYSVDPDGDIRWTFQQNTIGSRTTPAIDKEGTIYFTSGDNFIYAINPDGSKKWRYKTIDYMQSSPVIDSQGRIYASDKKLYVLNPKGELEWLADIGNKSESGVAIAPDGTVYAPAGHFNVSGTGELFAFNPIGSKKWAYPAVEGIRTFPTIAADGTIYITTGGSDLRLYAIDNTGKVKWKSETGKVDSYSSPTLDKNGNIYVGSAGSLHSFTPAGDVHWDYSISQGSIVGTPLIDSNGVVYFGTSQELHSVLAVNSNGTKKWSYQTESDDEKLWSSPVIGKDGVLYIGSHKNKVYAFQDCVANSEWCGADKYYTCNANGTGLSGSPLNCPAGCDWDMCMTKHAMLLPGQNKGGVAFSDSAGVKLKDTNFTVEYWFKGIGGSQTLVKGSWGDNDVNYVITEGISGDHVAFIFAFNYNNEKFSWRGQTPRAGFDETKWNHVAYCYDNYKNEARFYVNGTKIDMTSKPATWPQGIASFSNKNAMLTTIGLSYVIDELRFSSVPRYDANFTPEKRFEKDKSTQALYHFDEGTGTLVHDSSNTNSHGTMFNTSAWTTDTP